MRIRNIVQRLLFFLALAGWFGWLAVMSFGFYMYAHSSKVTDPATGRLVQDWDKGVTFFVHRWEYTVFHWGLPAAFSALAIGMGASMLFFREEYKRQIRHPATIFTGVLSIAAAIWVVHTFSK